MSIVPFPVLRRWTHRCIAALEEKPSRQQSVRMQRGKQLKVVLALYDDAKIKSVRSNSLLRRSAENLRATVGPCVSEDQNSIDKAIRLVLTGSGPHYRAAAEPLSGAHYLGRTKLVRRVGNMYYDVEYANLCFREMVLSRGRLKEYLIRMHHNFAVTGNELGNLHPTHGKTMWRLVEDIFDLPPLLQTKEHLMRKLQGLGEFERLSIDGTAKVCLRTLGQRRCAAPIAQVSEPSLDRRVLTVRGSSGAVLALSLIREEAADQMAETFARKLSMNQRACVVFIATDAPSRHMWSTYTLVFPNLECLSLDPTHLCMHYETASGGH